MRLKALFESDEELRRAERGAKAGDLDALEQALGMRRRMAAPTEKHSPPIKDKIDRLQAHEPDLGTFTEALLDIYFPRDLGLSMDDAVSRTKEALRELGCESGGFRLIDQMSSYHGWLDIEKSWATRDLETDEGGVINLDLPNLETGADEGVAMRLRW